MFCPSPCDSGRARNGCLSRNRKGNSGGPFWSRCGAQNELDPSSFLAEHGVKVWDKHRGGSSTSVQEN